VNILIIGDSQAAGAPGRLFEAKLREGGHATRRVGYPGHGAEDWVRLHWREYESLLRAFRPDQVVMIFGSNDPASERLSSALERFKGSNPKVYYAGPPRYNANPETQAKGEAIRSMASRVFGGTYLDAYPYTGPSVPRASDGVHFGVTGAGIWASGMLREWSSPASIITRNLRSLPGWAGPVVLLGGAAIAFGLWKYSRSR